MDQNRKFALLNGLCWHESLPNFTNCKKCGVLNLNQYPLGRWNNLDFSDPREVLKVVMEPYPKFIELLFSIDEAEYYSYNPEKRRFIFNKFIDYITTPGKLRDAWIEWKEKT
jgi:hypothetical protein